MTEQNKKAEQLMQQMFGAMMPPGFAEALNKIIGPEFAKKFQEAMGRDGAAIAEQLGAGDLVSQLGNLQAPNVADTRSPEQVAQSAGAAASA